MVVIEKKINVVVSVASLEERGWWNSIWGSQKAKQNPVKASGSRSFHFKLLCVLVLFPCHIEWEPGGRVNLASPEGPVQWWYCVCWVAGGHLWTPHMSTKCITSLGELHPTSASHCNALAGSYVSLRVLCWHLPHVCLFLLLCAPMKRHLCLICCRCSAYLKR